MQGVHEIDNGERIACESSWIERDRDGNGWISMGIHPPHQADLKFK